MRKVEVVSATEAVGRIRSGSTVMVDGSGGGINEPGAVLAALEERYVASQEPRDLTLVHVSGMGDGHGGGMDRLAHRGLVKRVIGGHWSWCRRMQEMADRNEIEAYCLPQGTLSHLMREIAAHRPGVISRVGIGTSVDPRVEGGKLNAAAADDLVELIEIKGTEYLFVPTFPIDVTIIRASWGDEFGNLSMRDEGLYAEVLAAAQAAKNSGGLVIAQVKTLVQGGSMDPRTVRVPGVLVDYLVVDPSQRLSFETDVEPALTGEARTAADGVTPMPLTARKVIARRAAMEVHAGDVVNLGFGMPDGVANVLTEERLEREITLTVEQGHVGGTPAGGANFGLAYNQGAMVDAGNQFDWYDGGGLDTAVLSFAQVDRFGNVNVSKYGGRISGVGGFINISQGAKRIIFVGISAVGPTPEVGDATPPIVLPEVKSRKFVQEVEQISFSGPDAIDRGQEVFYVTESFVMRLEARGPVLVEIAPGLSPDDLLSRFEFEPLLAEQLRDIPLDLYREPRVGLSLKSKE